MSISIQSSFNHLVALEQKTVHLKNELFHVQDQCQQIQKLHEYFQADLKEYSQIDWENDVEKRALLDQVYDSNFLPNFQDRVYTFTDSEQIELFIQDLQASFSNQQKEIENKQELYSKEKEDLMKWYQQLLEIISNFSQCVLTFAQRI